MRPCRAPRVLASLCVWLVLLGAVGSVLPATAQTLSAPAAPAWAGVVTYVVDGDTVYVRPLAGGTARSVRVLGMDAPEICQDGGQAARDALQARVFQRQVQIQGQGTDDYGRELGIIYLGLEDVGQWMVQRGYAWSYRFRQNPGPYAQSEHHARVLGRGIFAESAPENPRDFRRRHGPCPH
jgi:micrococcal nuclease